MLILLLLDFIVRTNAITGRYSFSTVLCGVPFGYIEMNKLSLFSAQLLRANVVTQLLNGIIAKSNRYISKSTPSSQDIDHTYSEFTFLIF